MSGTAPISADPDRLDRLHARTAEVANVYDAIFPSAFETCERLRELLASPNPWAALDERRAVTSVAARLHVVSAALLGLLAEHELVLPDRDDLAGGLADRGVFLASKRGWFRRGRK